MKIDYDFTTPFWEVSFLRPVIGNNEAVDSPRRFKNEERWNVGKDDFPSFRKFIDEIRVNYRFSDGLYGGIFDGSISLRPDIATTQKFMTDNDTWWKYMTGIKIRFGYRGTSPNAATKPFTAFATHPTGSLGLNPDIGFKFAYMGDGIMLDEGLVLEGEKRIDDCIMEIAEMFKVDAIFRDADSGILSNTITISPRNYPAGSTTIKSLMNNFLTTFASTLDYTISPGEKEDDNPVLRIINRPSKKDQSTPKPEVMFVWGRPINLQADPPVLPIEDFEAETNWNFHTRAFAMLKGPSDISEEMGTLLQAKKDAATARAARIRVSGSPIRNNAGLKISDENAQKFGEAGLVFNVKVTIPTLPNLQVGDKVGLMIGNNFIGGTKGIWQVWNIEHTLAKSGFKSRVHILSRPSWMESISAENRPQYGPPKP